MLFVRHHGDSGSRVVLLHGGPGAPGHMAGVARGLADTHRILEPFQRGSGAEPLTVARHVEDLHEVIRALAPERPPAILGSSWGAMLALAYGAAHPEATGPLILVGCGTFDTHARSRLRETLERRRAAGLTESALYSCDAVGAPEDAGFDEKAHHQSWDDMVSLQEQGVYPAAFAAIRGPVLMVHGEFDPHPGALIRAGLQAHIPQLEYRELKQCGHYPWLERHASEVFFSLVREWLRTHT